MNTNTILPSVLLPEHINNQKIHPEENMYKPVFNYIEPEDKEWLVPVCCVLPSICVVVIILLIIYII